MSEYTVGLDLGQSQDHSALVIVEKRQDVGYEPAQVRTVTTRTVPRGWWDKPQEVTQRVIYGANGDAIALDDLPSPNVLSYDVRHIMRWSRGTSYPTIVSEVNALMARAPLLNRAPLIVDGTGVGRAVVDLFRQSAGYAMTPVHITAGATVSYDDAGYTHVPKRDLVGTVQVLLQNKQLRIGPGLPEAQTLTSELQTFQTKININTAHESYGAWREGTHDDLVLSLALALWHANRPGIQAGWLDDDDDD